ncbi:hypothetical protein M2137_002100 [Parabacteroides sp. PFB2-10]|nr:hypothetical protein [Parabacteroides sp. PFB2-10]
MFLPGVCEKSPGISEIFSRNFDKMIFGFKSSIREKNDGVRRKIPQEFNS